MYLSKILIIGDACRNPYDIHQTLWRLFPNTGGATRDFLFRIEHSELTRAEILMQSETMPESPSMANVKILAWKEYRLVLNPSQKLRFLLIANPIKTINDEAERKKITGETKKCRVPLIKEDDQKLWVERKFQDSVSFETFTIEPIRPIRFYKAREERVGKIQPVSFQGILNVKNVEGVKKLIEKGIGPAKAFGCGLLSLAKV